MKIALIGYGKMGKTIEKLALGKGHEIVYKTDCLDTQNISREQFNNAEVAIEFTQPQVAPLNIKSCFYLGIPVVSGTTGWLQNSWDDVLYECTKSDGSFFYASNFSIGVNIFFEINARLAKLMNSFPEYYAEMEEIHHIHKLDAPSGTAISLAEGIISNNENYSDWFLKNKMSPDHIIGKIKIESRRLGETPGTHIIKYNSPIDEIEISHIAKGREGFATGAILAAEWLKDKTGIYGMKDLLKL